MSAFLAANPFVRLLLPLVAGVILAEYLPLEGYYTVALAASAVGLGAVAMVAAAVKTSQWWVFGVIITAALVALGAWRVRMHDERLQPNYIGTQIPTQASHEARPMIVVGTVVAPPAAVASPTANTNANGVASVRLRLRVDGIQPTPDDTTAVNPDLPATSGTLLVYLRDTTAKTLAYGDRIAVFASPHRITTPQNPDGFDATRYFHFQNIHYSLWADADHWQHFGASHDASPLTAWAIAAQRRCVAILTRYLPDTASTCHNDAVNAVSSALIVGYTDDLDGETKQRYTRTGALHVLSVSGLHVGLVYGFLVWLFRSMGLGIIRDSTQKTRWRQLNHLLQPLLLLAAVWGFSLLTGAAPATLRSAVMLSMLIVGKAINRRASGCNILAAAAFGLLLYDPYLLWQVGFELSFLAVLGLVTLYEPIQALWIPNIVNPLTDGREVAKPLVKVYQWLEWSINWAWELTAVGIAAQLATLPLSLYYFHQFPSYFWLSGLAVIPLSTAALYAGIGVLASEVLLGWIPYLHHVGFAVAKVCGWILFGLVWLMNALLGGIESLPLAVFEGLRTTGLEALLASAAIVAFFAGFAVRRADFLQIALLLAITAAASATIHKWAFYTSGEIVAYDTHRHSALSAQIGRRAVVISDTAYTHSLKARNPATNHFNAAYNLPLTYLSLNDTLTNPYLCYRSPVLVVAGKRIGIYSDAEVGLRAAQPLVVDAIWLTGKHYHTSPDDLLALFASRTLIIDNPHTAERLQTEAAAKGLRVWATTTAGAWAGE